MVRHSVVLLAVVLTIVSVSHAHWYGKRGDKADLISAFLRHRVEAMQSTTIGSDEALSAISEIIRIWQTQKEQASIEGTLKARR
ncbi:hypothetical protein SNE40_015656 [Patella caerulea]|uniref:Uncharacterized protein n=1 Tax=Patella caerulea TaxID=87958 RepID=A0AAN8PJL6_PATCE